MDNDTKFKILNQAPLKLDFNHKSVCNPHYNGNLSAPTITLSDEQVQSILNNFEIFEGPCNSHDFGKYNNTYMAIQESLAQFNTGLDYIWYKKLNQSYRSYHFVVKSADGNFVWEVNQDIHTNPNRFYVGGKMLKTSHWIKYGETYQQQLVKENL